MARKRRGGGVGDARGGDDAGAFTGCLRTFEDGSDGAIVGAGSRALAGGVVGGNLADDVIIRAKSSRVRRRARGGIGDERVGGTRARDADESSVEEETVGRAAQVRVARHGQVAGTHDVGDEEDDGLWAGAGGVVAPGTCAAAVGGAEGHEDGETERAHQDAETTGESEEKARQERVSREARRKEGGRRE